MEWKDKARNIKSQTATRKMHVADITKSYNKKAIDKMNYAKAKREEQRQAMGFMSTPMEALDEESDKHFRKIMDKESKTKSKHSHKEDLHKLYMEDVKKCLE